ncbi:MAG: STAS domain-containing protein [Pyrinomonadaceae bacterium]
MSSLSISKRQVGDVYILDLDGKILLGETNRQLNEAIYELIAEGKNRVVLNLEKVTAIDSSGLGEIVAGFSTLVKAGGTLKLVNMPSRVTDIMTVTKLYTVFDVYDTEADAVNSFDQDDVTAAA